MLKQFLGYKTIKILNKFSAAVWLNLLTCKNVIVQAAVEKQATFSVVKFPRTPIKNALARSSYRCVFEKSKKINWRNFCAEWNV